MEAALPSTATTAADTAGASDTTGQNFPDSTTTASAACTKMALTYLKPRVEVCDAMVRIQATVCPRKNIQTLTAGKRLLG